MNWVHRTGQIITGIEGETEEAPGQALGVTYNAQRETITERPGGNKTPAGESMSLRRTMMRNPQGIM